MSAEYGDDIGYSGREILEINWSLCALSGAILAVRLYAQLKLKRELDTNDYFMIFAGASSIAASALLTESVKWGLGRRTTLSDRDEVQLLKWAFLSAPLSATGAMLGRIACALFLLKFAGPTKQCRYLLWTLIISQAVIHFGAMVQFYLQCRPLQTRWDRHVPGQCWDFKIQLYMVYITGTVNSTTDLLLTLTPICIVSRLKMSRTLKTSLGVVLGLSVFAMAASIIKTTKLTRASLPQHVTDNSFIVWQMIENYVVITAGSLPKVWPLYVDWRKRRKQADNLLRENSSTEPGPRLSQRDVLEIRGYRISR